MNKLFVTSHVANAPHDVVWDAWTKDGQLEKWFGPVGLPIFSSRLEFEEGGLFLYGLKTPDGGEMWGKWNFQKISAPHSFTFLFHFSNAQGEITRHPWSDHWPLEVISTILLKEIGDKTEITVEWSPVNATAIEEKTFSDAIDGMKLGWSGTFSQLDKFLG